MTKPTPSMPAPIAVPWTPDMMTQTQAPVQAAAPALSMPVVPPAYQPPHMQAPQGQAQALTQGQHQAQQMPPQFTAPQGLNQPNLGQHPRQVQHQACPAAGAPQPFNQGHVQPAAYAARHQAPMVHLARHNPQAMQQMPQGIPQMMPPPILTTGQQGQPQMAAAVEGADAPESKSLLAKLLKRKPKAAPQQVPDVIATAPKTSGGLLNKSFGIGALTGLIVGAVVLPMVLGLFGGESSGPSQAIAQTEVQAPAVAPPVGGASEGGAFIDNALSTETP